MEEEEEEEEVPGQVRSHEIPMTQDEVMTFHL